MKTEKVFLYDNLCDPDLQEELFGEKFDSDQYMDYVTDWDLVSIKINGDLRKVAIEGGERTTIIGHVNYVPLDKLILMDKHYGREFIRIKVTTMLDSDCSLYIKRTDKIKKVI